MSDDPITRLNAALEGRYRIERELGEGGMATVYLADDLKHERKVALKVLKPELAAVVGAERFLAEIKTTANLQHPHILPLFDSGEADSFLFYAMPYVEGESLRQRLSRDGQLAVDEAVRIARECAEALQAAHDEGVIHRDIKPANILLSRGRPLVADFGIALAVSAAGGGRLTETGLSMGTPYYMSPEQASADKAPTAASDVYSLGCVLYEMLVGEPPYTGASAQAVLAKILTADAAQPTLARPSIPANVDAAIRRALEKLPADRFRTIQEFADALASPEYRYGETEDGVATGVSPGWKRAAWGLAALSGLLTVGVVALAARLGGVETPELARFEMAFDDGERPQPAVVWVEFDIAPDGSGFVYVGPGGNGGTQIWERRRDDLRPRPLAGTQNGLSPVYSPDGSSVLFFDGAGLSVVPLAGGPAVQLVDNVLDHGTWSDDGWVYFNRGGAIHRVLATGGAPELIAETEEGALRWLSALPGGEALLATLQGGGPSNSRVVAVTLPSGDVTELTAGTMARFAAPGHLVFTAPDGTLMAAAFDPDDLESLGPPVAMLEGVQVKGNSASQFAVSRNGSLLYKTGASSTGLFRLVWVSPDGTIERLDPDLVFDASSPGNAGVPELAVRLSPDERRIALKITSEGGEDIWVRDLDGGSTSRLTFYDGIDRRPEWSADGTRIMFNSDRGEDRDLWERAADGTGSPELILDLDRPILEAVRTPDEEWFILRLGGSAARVGGRDIVGLRRGDTILTPLAAESYDEKAIALSPDGRWLAYESTETGQDEVYVRPFPNVDDGKWQISSSGGITPRWARSGDGIYYVSGRRELTLAEIDHDGGRVRVDARIPFYNVDELALRIVGNYTVYDVASDGRALMIQFDVGEGAVNRLVLVDHWSEELKARVPN